MLRKEIRDEKKVWDETNGVKLKGIVDDLEAPEKCIIIRPNNKVYWLTIRGNTVTVTVLAAT